MKFRKFLLSLALAGAMALPTVAIPDDIDLYTGGENITGAETNVLIFLDNSANWSNASGWTTTQGEAELDALKTVIDTLNDTVNVGVMMHNRSGSTSGAYVRFAMRPMSEANRAALKEVFDDIKSTAPNAPQDKVAQSADGDAAIEETFRYFNSLTKGFNITDSKQDYLNNTAYYDAGGSVSAALEAKAHPATSPLTGPAPGVALLKNAYDSLDDDTYNGPTSASLGCAKNYLIWIGNTNLDGSTNGTRLTAAAGEVGTTATITQVAAISNATGASTPTGKMFDEWTRFMYEKGVRTSLLDSDGNAIWNNITTYTVDVFPQAGSAEPKTCTEETAGGAQQVGQHFNMQSGAKQGGGKCFPATNTAQLSAALQTIFAEIQAVNSVFASATLPVSVNTQGTYENQVYIGVFRPDGFARPRWYGNLKGYQFARYCDFNSNNLVDNVGGEGDERIDGNATPATCSGDTLKLYLADRNKKPAIDQTLGSGFLDLQATSFWTQNSTFWSFSPDPISGSSDAPDGPMVERGGAAYRQRTLFPVKTAASGTADIDHRNVYTCVADCIASNASADDKLLSNNLFVDTNTDVTSLLTSTWPMSVSLSRTGNTLTVTTASAHGLGAGDTITISGTGSADYDKTHTVVSGSGSSLTIAVTEKPLDDTSGAAIVSTGASVKTISSISVNTAGTLATVSATAHGFSTLDSITIGGATQTFLNGTFTITKIDDNSFSFPVTWTAPASPATAAGTTSFGSPVNSPATANTSLTRPDAAQPHVVLGVWSDDVPITGNPKATVGVTQLTVASTTSPDYSGTYTLKETGASCPGTSSFSAAQKKKSYCYDLIKSETGSGLTATKTGGDVTNVNLTRSGTTVTATRVSGAALVGGTVTISGSSQSEYNGSKSTVLVDADHITFSVTVTPPTTATGSATVPNQPTVTAANLVNWMRGVDNSEDENSNSSLTDVRASIQGDVLHSRPLLINYGGATGIYGFYGSNDGFLRAIKGGTADTDGGEQWAFIPEEFVNRAKLARLYENSTPIRYPNSICPASDNPNPTPRPYFWDGQFSAYQSDDLATTYIFAGMRRGGRSIYAFDVSTPTVPKIMWRVNETSTGFSQLAYTWSEPKAVWIKDVSVVPSGKRLVLVFGAGYDPTDDDQKPGAVRGDRAGYTGIGRGVFVVDALSGALIRFLEVPAGVRKYSFAADVTTFDYDGDGLVDRIYAVDTGAQLFRFDQDGTENPTSATGWKSYHLANFGDTGADGGSDARRFLYPPEVVPFVFTKSDLTKVPAMMVLVGSGDREKPLPNYRRDSATNTYVQNTLTCPSLYADTYFGTVVDDHFYGFVDSTATLGTAPTVATEADMLGVNAGAGGLAAYDLCYAFQTNCVSNVTNAIMKGWMIDLKLDPDGGGYGEEKLVNAPRVVSGVALFSTNVPRTPDINAGICSNLGVASSYAVSPFTGLPAFDRNGDGIIDGADFAATVTGGGLPPSVTAGVVGIDDDGDGDADSFHRFVIGAGGKEEESLSPIEGAKNPITLKGTRSRVYWFYPTDSQ